MQFHKASDCSRLVRARKGRIAFAVSIALAAASGASAAAVTGFDSFTSSNGATVTGTGAASSLTITDGNGGEARSAYYSGGAVPVTNFVSTFTYTTSGGADGFTFILQNDPAGTSALGDGGGKLGYSGDAGSALKPITFSAVDAFNIYTGNGGSKSGAGTLGTIGYTTTPNVDITSGHPINVTLSYRQQDQALVETLADTVAGTRSTKVYRGIDFQTAVGNTSALVGFTGGTGGIASTQTVSNFTFTNNTAPAAPAITRPIIPLTIASGFNQDLVVEASANPSSGGTPANAVTATYDGGTSKAGDTFFQQGYEAISPNAGLPTGKTFFSRSNSNAQFALASAVGNNALLLDNATTSGSLTLATPVKLATLSVLTSTGGGSAVLVPTLHFSDGSTSTLAPITSPDWFDGSDPALFVDGRVTVSDGSTNNVNNPYPRLFELDIPLTGLTQSISSVSFNWSAPNGGAPETAIFGLSGELAATPEPATLSLLAMGGLAAMSRRRRRSAIVG